MSVSQACNALSRELLRSLREGEGCPLEADSAVNDASRAVVEATAEEHGQVWLGQINLYYKDRRSVMWKWDGQFVYNFTCAFVAPNFDEELVRLIQKRDAASASWSAAADTAWLKAICDRIDAIGGVTLTWT